MDVLSNGKQSLAINLKVPEGVKILCDLSKRADVLLDPFRSGVMESLGLGPDTLLNINKRLIYARLSGYGQNSYYSKHAGHDINYLAMSGLLSLFGRYNENPIFPVNLGADFGGGGLMCALGIILALYERSVSGKGQVVNCDMVSGTAYLGSWLYRSQKLPIWGKERGKNILDSGSHFYEVYKTKDDKFISVGAIEPQFYDDLLKGLGLNNEQAPQFDKFEENKELFSNIFATKTQKEWCEIFDKLDACVAPVLLLNETPHHVHTKDMFTVDAEGNAVPLPRPRLSRTPAEPSSVNRDLVVGEHTAEILKNLGFSKKAIVKLEEEGIVQTHKLSKL